MHIVQQKLNDIKAEWNSHRRRPNRTHPGGIPNVLFCHPQLQGIYFMFKLRTHCNSSAIEQ